MIFRADDPEGTPDKSCPEEVRKGGFSLRAHTTSISRVLELVRAPDRFRSVRSPAEDVGTPDYPSGIPDMHTIHDPMISVS
jgi:hypothetical protein